MPAQISTWPPANSEATAVRVLDPATKVAVLTFSHATREENLKQALRDLKRILSHRDIVERQGK